MKLKNQQERVRNKKYNALKKKNNVPIKKEFYRIQKVRRILFNIAIIKT